MTGVFFQNEIYFTCNITVCWKFIPRLVYLDLSILQTMTQFTV